MDIDDPIVIAPYDPRWPIAFGQERQRLLDALHGMNTSVEHIGSTAVPGLAAKPTIDIQVALDPDDFGPATARLEGLGYEVSGSEEPGHRFLLLRSGGRRVVHAHLCVAGGDWESRHLLFRDFLRSHPVIARAYADVKRDLAAVHRDDREAYVDAKTPHIAGIMQRAREWFASTTPFEGI